MAALLPAVDAPAARPALGAALGAAALASPLSTLLATAGAVAASLRCLAEGPVDERAGFAVFLAAGAAVAASGAWESGFAARLRSGADPAQAALAGGVLTVSALLWLGRGSLLRWSLALGDGAARLGLRGAALVLGTALLASILGVLALAAHGLVPSAHWALALGRRALMLGGGAAALGFGLTVARGLDRAPEALATAAGALAGLVLAVLVLAAGLLILLGAPGGRVAPDARVSKTRWARPWPCWPWRREGTRRGAGQAPTRRRARPRTAPRPSSAWPRCRPRASRSPANWLSWRP